jgi:hypothetical protein
LAGDGEAFGATATGEVAGDAAGVAAGDAAGEAPEVGAGGLAPGDACGAADGAGLVLAGGGAFSSSTGARLPIFDKSGPTLILPSSTGRSKR